MKRTAMMPMMMMYMRRMCMRCYAPAMGSQNG